MREHMFKLKTKVGNIFREVKTERERNYFLGLGYVEVKEEPKPPKEEPKKVSKKK
jgi:hypothetical protein